MICTQCLTANLDITNTIIWTGNIYIHDDNDSLVSTTSSAVPVPIRGLLHFSPFGALPPAPNEGHYQSDPGTYTYLDSIISIDAVALINGENLCEQHAYTTLA